MFYLPLVPWFLLLAVTFVIDGKRKVTFAKVSTGHGDRAKTDDVLKALTK